MPKLRVVTAWLGLLAAGMAGVLPIAPPAAAATYRWKHRPLYVFSPPGGSALAAQRRIVAEHSSGMRERDMVVIWVVGDTVTAELGGGPAESAGVLRRRFGVSANEFRAVLVGKDGGAKITQAAPLSASRLFATIDAMPMRRDEMRRRG